MLTSLRLISLVSLLSTFISSFSGSLSVHAHAIPVNSTTPSKDTAIITPAASTFIAPAPHFVVYTDQWIPGMSELASYLPGKRSHEIDFAIVVGF